MGGCYPEASISLSQGLKTLFLKFPFPEMHQRQSKAQTLGSLMSPGIERSKISDCHQGSCLWAQVCQVSGQRSSGLCLALPVPSTAVEWSPGSREISYFLTTVLLASLAFHHVFCFFHVGSWFTFPGMQRASFHIPALALPLSGFFGHSTVKLIALLAKEWRSHNCTVQWVYKIVFMWFLSAEMWPVWLRNRVLNFI